MAKLFTMAAPILPGKTQQWRKFADELKGKRNNEFRESRKKLNVHERTFLQPTPMGDLVIVTLTGDDPANAFQKFGQGNDSFTQWFTQQVREIHGIDLKNPPESGMPELVVDSREEVYQL